MKLTPGAANLLLKAGDRCDRDDRAAFASDIRIAINGDQAAFSKLVDVLKK